MRLLFSQRYHRAIEQAALVVDIPDAARRKIWAWLRCNITWAPKELLWSERCAETALAPGPSFGMLR